MRFKLHTCLGIFSLIWVAISVTITPATAANSTLIARTLEDSTAMASCSDGICEVSETSNSCPQDCSNLLLSGTNAGTRGAQGVMFEMKAKRDVTIKSFSFYTDAARSGRIEVYTLPGSYVGKELVASGWSLVFSKTVDQNGRDVLTRLGDFDTGVTIRAGSMQSFYIVTVNYIMYDAGSIEGGTLSEDTSLILYQGVGITGPAFPGLQASDVMYRPRIFKGTISYDAISITNNPTKNPVTSFPTKRPSINPTKHPMTPGPSKNPTPLPTNNPSNPPTSNPTRLPTNNPTPPPSLKPTTSPTKKPVTNAPTTQSPTQRPTTPEPSKQPTQQPTNAPTTSPTKKPTPVPSTATPTRLPTNDPTPVPSTAIPSKQPTQPPTNNPSLSPTKKPTPIPSTANPTHFPTKKPTSQPTFACNNDGTCQASETATTCSQDCANLSLQGTNAGTRGAQGVMFEMKAKRDVTIKSLSFYTDAARSGRIEVYTLPGSYIGKELVASGWSLVFSKTVDQNGRDVLTQLDEFDTGVTIRAGSMQSFYIVTVDYVMYDAGSIEGGTLSEDTSLILYQGKGISGPAFPGAGTSGVLWSPRIFKGTIMYDAISIPNSPTKQPVTPSPTNPLTPSPTKKPTSKPIAPPTKKPTPAPTKKPSLSAPPTTRIPTPMPTIDNYKYISDTTRCNGSTTNIQGPAPLPDKSNVALQFFAFGDTPYDDSCSSCNTCIVNGVPQANCNIYSCTVSNSNIGSLPIGNTCTYEGVEFACLRDTILPYMQSKTIASEAAFSVHVGDIIKGKPDGNNRRCQDSSFRSRKNLFSALDNFLLVPGDNDWNECAGYNINSNTDWVRSLWRRHFAENTSPFNAFTRDFPSLPGIPSQRPNIARKVSNPEMFYFEYNNVAVFGLNRVDGNQWVDDVAPTDVNADWVLERLTQTSCSLKSIVMVVHIIPSNGVNNALNSYFSRCGATLPTLTITGNDHPTSYCMFLNSSIPKRVDLTVEAFSSGPLAVSIVRSPSGEHFFHVRDADTVNSNSFCPNLQI